MFLLRCPAAASPVEAGLRLADRGHSLRSLSPPPAALPSLPLSHGCAVPAPLGKGSLFLLRWGWALGKGRVCCAGDPLKLCTGYRQARPPLRKGRWVAKGDPEGIANKRPKTRGYRLFLLWCSAAAAPVEAGLRLAVLVIPSVKNQRFLPAPLGKGSPFSLRWGALLYH